MTITNFTPITALCGGALIGLGIVLVFFLNGKVAGFSGVLAGILRPTSDDKAWRALFVLGLIAGGALILRAWPAFASFQLRAGWVSLLGAGFATGLGTRLGGGCTSGHGVCGLSRGSLRSLVATITFMAAGFVTVYVLRHVLEAG